MLEVVKANFETKKGRKRIYRATSLQRRSRNRTFPDLCVVVLSSLFVIRNSDFELVPKTTFPIPTRRQKNVFGQKVDTLKFPCLKLLRTLKIAPIHSKMPYSNQKCLFSFYYVTFCMYVDPISRQNRKNEAGSR